VPGGQQVHHRASSVFPVKVETNDMSDQAATGKKDGLIEFSPSPQKAEALFIHLQAMLQEQAELLDETKKSNGGMDEAATGHGGGQLPNIARNG
jgi:hypothetical protein